MTTEFWNRHAQIRALKNSRPIRAGSRAVTVDPWSVLSDFFERPRQVGRWTYPDGSRSRTEYRARQIIAQAGARLRSMRPSLTRELPFRRLDAAWLARWLRSPATRALAGSIAAMPAVYGASLLVEFALIAYAQFIDRSAAGVRFAGPMPAGMPLIAAWDGSRQGFNTSRTGPLSLAQFLNGYRGPESSIAQNVRDGIGGQAANPSIVGAWPRPAPAGTRSVVVGIPQTLNRWEVRLLFSSAIAPATVNALDAAIPITVPQVLPVHPPLVGVASPGIPAPRAAPPPPLWWDLGLPARQSSHKRRRRKKPKRSGNRFRRRNDHKAKVRGRRVAGTLLRILGGLTEQVDMVSATYEALLIYLLRQVYNDLGR